MSKEVNKFILEGEEIEFSDSKAREDITSLDTKIDNEVGRLETEINGKATIDDSDITANKTWSSGQIFAEDNTTREITATLNLTNRADQAYNVGDLMVFNSKLYKVTASISQGDLLTPGTNLQLSKVSTELKGLENTCGNLQSQINNKATIDDSDITTSKTWSSSKILSEDISIRENIATLNITNLAEQNYDVGDLIEWNYKLCKVIAPISQGDLLELGANLNRTTVAKINTDIDERIDAYEFGTRVDLTIYNSPSNRFTFPSDGYVRLSVGDHLNQYVVVKIKAPNTTYQFGVTAFSPTSASSNIDNSYNSVFVKKGMQCYVDTFIGTDGYIDFLPLQ